MEKGLARMKGKIQMKKELSRGGMLVRLLYKTLTSVAIISLSIWDFLRDWGRGRGLGSLSFLHGLNGCNHLQRSDERNETWCLLGE